MKKTTKMWASLMVAAFAMMPTLNTHASTFYSPYESEVITNQVQSVFPDVAAGTLEAKAANYLAERNIIGGRPDGTFDGEAPVNRAEAAKFLLLAADINVNRYDDNGQFPDVKRDEWYARYVLKAAEMDIINGYPNGLFAPADQVNTAEFLKMMSLALDLPAFLDNDYIDVSRDAWYYRYAGVAQKYNLFPDRSDKELLPAEELTRREVAIAIYQYLVEKNDDEVVYPNPEPGSGGEYLEVKKTSDHRLLKTESGDDALRVLSLEFKSEKAATYISEVTLKRLSATGDIGDFQEIWAVINTDNGPEERSSISLQSDEVTVPVGVFAGEGYGSVIVDFYVEVSNNAPSGNSSRWVIYRPDWIKTQGDVPNVGLFPIAGRDIVID